jgi:hypothetical protein
MTNHEFERKLEAIGNVGRYGKTTRRGILKLAGLGAGAAAAGEGGPCCGGSGAENNRVISVRLRRIIVSVTGIPDDDELDRAVVAKYLPAQVPPVSPRAVARSPARPRNRSGALR